MNSDEDLLKDKTELQDALMSIVKKFDTLEETNRLANIRIWKKCENYWHHLQSQYWSADTGDWMSPSTFYQLNPEVYGNLAVEEMKIVNIYRAHGESIAAALSIKPPQTRFFPENADEANDVTTAKAFSKIAKLIERQNKAKLLLMRMVYILFNQAFVAVYNFPHESKEYGGKEVPIVKTKKIPHSVGHCSECGEQLANAPTEDTNTEVPIKCSACGNEALLEYENKDQEVQYHDGTEFQPKCRQKLNVYGSLNVKISSFAQDQKNIGILILDVETDIANAQEMYPNIAGQIRTGPIASEVVVQARMPNNLYDAYQRSQVTVRNIWLRPWQFNAFTGVGSDPTKDPIVMELKKLFPDGVCIHAVNDKYAESYPENLDSCWSISFNPMSRYLHSDPIGQGLLPIQDMTNEMVNLELESIEYGLPEQFVDPEVLDLEAYKDQRGGPGMVFPIKSSLPGKAIADHFYTNKQATLTDEAGRFEGRLLEHGQFISGDYPSIYGGPNTGDTAAEYSMSRQQALQRLSTTWTIIQFLWADVMSKATNSYVASLKDRDEDDYFVESAGGEFFNTWILQQELQGKIGEVYPEENEQFPISWSAQREILLQLMQQQNPLVDAVLSDPSNRSMVASLIGLPEFNIPGDKDRIKQLNEITDLLQADPIMPMIEGQLPQSSIQPEEIDEHDIHIATCDNWMKSEVGLYYKKVKPAQYANVMIHRQAHLMMMMQKMLPSNPNPDQGEQGNEKINSNSGVDSNTTIQ